jgi:hypothetical protein
VFIPLHALVRFSASDDPEADLSNEAGLDDASQNE